MVRSSGATAFLPSNAEAELRFWDGGDALLHDNGAIDGGAGAWRRDGRNWTDADGEISGPFQPVPSFAVFQGTGDTVGVDNGNGVIGVTGMQFATDGYRIEGDAIELAGLGGEILLRIGDGTAHSTGVTATIASSLTGDSALVRAISAR